MTPAEHPLPREHVRAPEQKIMTLAEAVEWRRVLKDSGRQLVVTNGCFDLMHRGHVEYLARAREVGDSLLVAINSDASISAIKGPGRPVVPEDDRAYTVASLEAVDAVVVFSTPKALGLIRQLTPNVYVKGGDYTVETIDQEERVLLDDIGARIVFVTLVSGFSTTEIIRTVRKGGQVGKDEG